MKNLKQHVVLYDATCPMCRLYTGAFVSCRMLDKDGRQPYQGLSPDIFPALDRVRAVNEIALVDRVSGTVTYGIESLFKILGSRWPSLRLVFRFPPFIAAMRYLYSLISYNRRVIMPAPDAVNDCPPAFHRGWRIAWIALCWLLCAFLLHRYNTGMKGLLPEGGLGRELAACGGQLVWQGLLIRWLKPAKLWDYLGTMMTLSFGGALSLTLLKRVLEFTFSGSALAAAGLFGLVVSLMILEHLRRTRLMGLGLIVTASWVLYRVALLLLILS